jgi:hypothetical protein
VAGLVANEAALPLPEEWTLGPGAGLGRGDCDGTIDGRDVKMVYIDDAFVPDGKGRTFCHLMADSSQELEAFARRLGIPQAWKHNDHYDIVAAKRQWVIRNGARPVKPEALVEIRRKLRRERVTE